MSRDGRRRYVESLSREDTRLWHSPYSATLREARRCRIVARCHTRAELGGYVAYALYDADEYLLAEGTVSADGGAA